MFIQGIPIDDVDSNSVVPVPIIATRSPSISFLRDISSYPQSSLFYEHLRLVNQAKLALANVSLNPGIVNPKPRPELIVLLPVSILGVFPKSISLSSHNNRLIIPAGSIVAGMCAQFTPNAAFGNELGWGQGGAAVVVLKGLVDGDLTVRVREQDESDGRLTLSGPVIEVLVKSVRLLEWHNVRRGNLNCFQGITWGCAALTQPLVLTWVASKRGNIEEDEAALVLSNNVDSSPMFSSAAIQEYVQRLPKPIGHYDTICIPLSTMKCWMSVEQYAALQGQADTDFEVMVMHVIPDRFGLSI